jgi:hypothetical protein
MDGESGRTPGRTIHGFPFYLIPRTVSAAAGFPIDMLRGDSGSALVRAADVAFSIGFAAQRWGLTVRGGREAIDVTGAPA